MIYAILTVAWAVVLHAAIVAPDLPDVTRVALCIVSVLGVVLFSLLALGEAVLP